MTYTAASFFSGIGAMDYAAIAGFRGNLNILHHVEVNPFKQQILRKHRRYWPEAVIHGDVREIDANTIGNVDLIYGGFPCKDISRAGTQEGLRGKHSGLWNNMARIIGTVRPRIVVLENVPAITHRGGTTVTADLTGMGYGSGWFTVSAYAFGSPQVRFRWFLLAYAGGIRYKSSPGGELHQKGFGTHRTGQQIPERHADQPACESCRAGVGWRRARRRNQSTLGRTAYGASARVDIARHEFPAGSWQPQKAGEPPRIAPRSETWASEVEALGDIALPQQMLPVFEAVYEFLEGLG